MTWRVDPPAARGERQDLAVCRSVSAPAPARPRFGEDGCVSGVGGVFVVATALAVGVSGCGAARGCTEIGWNNELSVEIAGAQPGEIAVIELCADEECIAPTGIDGENPDSTWTFLLGIDTPETVRVVARDSSGARLVSSEVSVAWSGTDEPNGPGCSNRSVASPVIIAATTLSPSH